MKVFKKVFSFGGRDVTIETGGVARQATAAVTVTMGDTVVLVTCVAKKQAKEGQSFFPLTINYTEKMYASGRIPGSFNRREGRPQDHETLICRLIDRPLRPLFPKGFLNEIQVVATVMSHDPSVTPDVLALIGASAAVTLSGVPFGGPIAAAKVGFKDGEYLLNPSAEQLVDSDLELVVAGTDKAVLMVESEANQLPEEVMLGAVLFGHEQMQVAIQAINELKAACGKPAWEWQAPEANIELEKKVSDVALAGVQEAYKIHDKQARYEALDIVRSQALEALITDDSDESLGDEIVEVIHDLEQKHVRESVLNGELRIDGRDTRTVRPINIKNHFLPRAHGSALFTRGETQAIVTATLGNDRDAQLIDAMHEKHDDRFMLNYNFPPYCVGETGMMMSPKRREIGHGNLARRAVAAVLPSQEEFPYVLRIVSEITESNGSSSMATVCGASLSMMDAGVPLKAPVAGIAMGLIKDDNRFAVLTDILGDEDHLGDMDFKVAGSATGITALQMDIKISGITKEIMEAALEQAKEARMHILGLMNECLSTPSEMSDHAPRIHQVKVHPDKVRDVIGKGGATIRSITEDTGVSIDIDDDGIVKIFATDNESAQKAIARVELATAEAEIGKVYHGKVVRLADFGAFVNILPGKDGLVHISQILHEKVDKVSDHLSEGQMVDVKVLDIDRQGRVKLSMKALLDEPAPQQQDD